MLSSSGWAPESASQNLLCRAPRVFWREERPAIVDRARDRGEELDDGSMWNAQLIFAQPPPEQGRGNLLLQWGPRIEAIHEDIGINERGHVNTGPGESSLARASPR